MRSTAPTNQTKLAKIVYRHKIQLGFCQTINKIMELDTKKGRGTSLSQTQYDIIVSYLNTGCKPSLNILKSAHLYGKLNGGKVTKSCCGYFRFKSIVNRLKLRQSDGALAFKGNGKIILPNSKFTAAISEAHTSPGYKHLNMTGTLAKLSEKYTIGCRQFGISEDSVRVVVKSCRKGSCSEKIQNRQGVNLMKNLVKSTNPDENVNTGPASTDNDTGVPTDSSSPTATVTSDAEQVHTLNVPKDLAKQEPAYAILEKQSTGGFIIKQFVMKMSPQSEAKTASTSDVSTPVKTSDVAVKKSKSPPFTVTQPAGLTLGNVIVMPCPLTTPPNLVKLYNPTLTRPIMSLPSSVRPMRFAIPVNFIMSNQQLPNAKDINMRPARNLFPFSQVPAMINEPAQAVPVHENHWKPFKADEGHTSMDDDNNMDVSPLNTSEDLNSSVDDCSMSEELHDLPHTNSVECLHGDADMGEHQGKVEIPLPFLWYSLKDLEREQDPFIRMNMAIKDMKLDVHESLRGSKKAMETLKSKIELVTQMVKAQQEQTAKYKDALMNY